MPFRRVISTLGCPDLTLEQALDLAERLGLDGIELRAVAGTVDVAGWLADTYREPPTLAGKLRGRRAVVEVIDASCRLMDGAPADTAELAALAPWADALGVRYLRVFDGADAGASGFRAAAGTVRWWNELRAGRGWRTGLMVETHDSLFTSAAIARFCAAVPGVPILWDTHHTWKKGGEDPLATWRAIRHHVVHVHVKDSTARPGADPAYGYVLPGTGEFPAAPLVAALRSDYSGAVCLEWERKWHPQLPPLEEAVDSAGRRGWW